MTFIDGLMRVLDTRSFGALWYWLVVIAAWSLSTRSVLGIPADVVRAARGDDGRAVMLLDWLALVLPRWRATPGEAATLTALAAFALTSLAILGFGYGYELAQALVLLLLPLGVLACLRLTLARRLDRMLGAARAARRPPAEAGRQAGRMMVRHRRVVIALSLAAVALTTAWGTLWGLMHPFRL